MFTLKTAVCSLFCPFKNKIEKIPESKIITNNGNFKYSRTDIRSNAPRTRIIKEEVKKMKKSGQKAAHRGQKAELATAIFPLEKIAEEELESRKIVTFYHAVDLMKQEGYVLNKDLTAVHEDADKPYFKTKFCKNGWELRRITNIEGWMVIIRYQRYRTRQQNKVRGVEKPTEFEVLEPRKQHYTKATKEAVKELYKMGNSVTQIIRAYEIQRGIVLKPGTVRNWVSEVARKTREIEVDIFELEKAMEKKIQEKQKAHDQ